MALTREIASNWLRKYLRAWETYDPATIADLFTEDASYRYCPFDEPVRGRSKIVESWLKEDRLDAPGTYEATYVPIAVEGDLAVANGRSRYYEDATRRKLTREYDNIFLLHFADDGRCRSFCEWYMLRPGQQEPE